MNVARVTEGRERHDPGQRERGLPGKRRKVVHPSSSSKTARCRQRLNRKLTPAPVRTRTWMQQGCTCAHAPPRPPPPRPPSTAALGPTPVHVVCCSLSFLMPLSRHLRRRQAWHCRRVFRVISQAPFRKRHRGRALRLMALLPEDKEQKVGRVGHPSSLFPLHMDASHILCVPCPCL